MIYFLADQTPSVTDPVITLVQYGLLGVILMLLLMGWLWPKPAVEQMLKRQEEERKIWIDQILPTMDRLSRNLETNNSLLRQSMRSRGVRMEETDDAQR